MSDTITPTSRFWPGFQHAFSTGAFVAPQMQVHGLSAASVMLELRFGETVLGKGTGWFWRQDDGVALVTAWHNFSGLHHTQRLPISPTGGMPDRVYYRYYTRNPDTLQDDEIPLYLDEDRAEPRWFVHPVYGSYVDIAFLMLSIEGADVTCVNDNAPVFNDQLVPGQDVFAIGFPQGINMTGIFPVWKRGSIASDPDLPAEGHPKFYVDLAGRGGLSGAPVLLIERGLIRDAQQPGNFGLAHEQARFVGIYSGRAADQLPPDQRMKESTDLGFVWRSSIVMEALAARVLDEQPEVRKGKLVMETVWHSAGQ